MKKMAIAGLVAALLAGVANLQAQAPTPPKPTKEHEWLTQLAGEWESEADFTAEPGKPAAKAKGTESIRSLGGIWIIAENKSSFGDVAMTGIMTLGYDPEKKKYYGTWVDSMTNYLWKYDGSMDATGKVLTLEAEGPNPTAAGKIGKFRDVIEVKDKDTKVLRSSMLGDDGKWVSFMTITYRRKK
jgi:hypothetical protein